MQHEHKATDMQINECFSVREPLLYVNAAAPQQQRLCHALSLFMTYDIMI